MSLDLGNHLLQALEGLVAAFLRHLCTQIVFGALCLIVSFVLHFSAFLLRLFWDVLRCLRLELTKALLSTSFLIHAAIGIRLLLGGILSICGRVLHVRPRKWLVFVDLRSHLRLEVAPGQIRGVVPRVVLSVVIDLGKLIVGWVNLSSNLGCSIACNVTEENRGITEKLSELPIGDHKRAEGPQSIKSLVTVLLGGSLVGGSAWYGSVATIKMLSLPDEVLEQITLILGEEKVFGLSDDFLDVGDKMATLF